MSQRDAANFFNSAGLNLLTQEHLVERCERLEEENRELKRRLLSAAERIRQTDRAETPGVIH
ncbi:hypothetical protein [Aureimonas sp. AU40]|uniref:hypothetical protein n=1 Tax=Aureimonas sp. AU40 TaxID=1637747 RepID=UPI0007833FEC|nr:hypothetical protein [Aureimonas sp. AU40]